MQRNGTAVLWWLLSTRKYLWDIYYRAGAGLGAIIQRWTGTYASLSLAGETDANQRHKHITINCAKCHEGKYKSVKWAPDQSVDRGQEKISSRKWSFSWDLKDDRKLQVEGEEWAAQTAEQAACAKIPQARGWWWLQGTKTSVRPVQLEFREEESRVGALGSKYRQKPNQEGFWSKLRTLILTWRTMESPQCFYFFLKLRHNMLLRQSNPVQQSNANWVTSKPQIFISHNS